MEEQNINKFNAIIKHFQSDASANNLIQPMEMDEFGSAKRQHMSMNNNNNNISLVNDELNHYSHIHSISSIVPSVTWQVPNRESIQYSFSLLSYSRPIIQPILVPMMSSISTNVQIPTTYEGDQSLVSMSDKIEYPLVTHPPLNPFISSHPSTSNSM
jgi:hypothetical protein